MVSFTVKAFWFDVVQFTYFAFVAFVWETGHKNISKPNVKLLIVYFSSRSIMVSGLTFMSLIHLWIYFHMCYETVVEFHSLSCSCLVFLTPFIEVTVFTLRYSYSLLSDGDSLRNSLLGNFLSLCEHHKVHLHISRCYSLLHT